MDVSPADRLAKLEDTMRMHDWMYWHRDDYGAWNRGQNRNDFIMRESYELRHMGFITEVDQLWNDHGPNQS